MIGVRERESRVVAVVFGRWTRLLSMLLLLQGSYIATAQIPSAEQLQTGPILPRSENLRRLDQILERKGSVTFHNSPLSEVIYTLSQLWNVNIVAGADVTGNVSGNFRDEPLREILDSLLSVNGYGYRQNGSSLLVLKQDQIGPNNPNFRAETLLLPRNLTNEAMSEVVGALRVFSSPNGGQLQPVPSNNALMVYDTPEKISQMQNMLRNLTQGNAPSALPAPGNVVAQVGPGTFPMGGRTAGGGEEVLRIRPQYVPAVEVAKAIELALGNGGSFATIESEETLLIVGTPEALRRVANICSQVDVPRSQVRITAYIYDVALGELERLGMDWSNQVMSQGVDSNGIPRNLVRNDGGLLTRANATPIVGNATPLSSTTGSGSGGSTGGTAAAAASGGQWVFRTLSSNFELNTVLQALDETKGAKLLADPHVTVVDRQTASIDIITKIPVQQLTQTQQGGSIGTTAFEEAGIKLDVTPRIANDGTVEMKVTPEFSALAGFNSNGNPIIDARRASTVVRVANQHTLVLGGLRQKTAVETVKGIPGLMNMKFIGALFRSHNTELRESELICFIQPEIVDNFTTGLHREEIALSQQKSVLGQIPLACPGPNVRDCRDPYCPYHHPRPRVNHGMYDDGLVMPGTLPANFPAPMGWTPGMGDPQVVVAAPYSAGPFLAPPRSEPSYAPTIQSAAPPGQQQGVIVPAEVFNGPNR